MFIESVQMQILYEWVFGWNFNLREEADTQIENTWTGPMPNLF